MPWVLSLDAWRAARKMNEPENPSYEEIDELRYKLRLFTVPTIPAQQLSLRIGANKYYVSEFTARSKSMRPQEPFLSRLLEQVGPLEEEFRKSLIRFLAAPP